MSLLTLNCGSSSVKFALFEPAALERRLEGEIEAIGTAEGRIQVLGEHRLDQHVQLADHHQALARLAALLGQWRIVPRAVGHRVVHGGERFHETVVVDDAVLAAIETTAALAPLHNPINLEGIRLAQQLWPQAVQIAAFDTAFHQTLPPEAFHYAVPKVWYPAHGVRRYGFHGLSHAYVTRRAAEQLGKPPAEFNAISLHLGSGASACAIENGKSIDTSMGLTPLEGLVMGTRPGDLDPGVLLHLLRRGLTAAALDEALNRTSGLKGLCGHADMREVRQAAAGGDEDARLALAVFCRRVKKYIGAYLALLGRIDALIFTAGIGQHSPEVRARCLEGLEGLGLTLDPQRNRQADGHTLAPIHHPEAKTAILVVPTDEAWQIAHDMQTLLNLRENDHDHA
ncbi:acetate kinase [Methylomarinovum caldicuralii]|uniref:Acetate kinase n=1 Tax=Methylomarinovum caldicuralii TaxID=438856 RepID=A0AAU9BSB8_9GAMM|nr:acetate kinase [Methylomarinovum caldicuralii]BCX81753.1 acetate kinase [Methylomarinovum caldicuralii]